MMVHVSQLKIENLQKDTKRTPQSDSKLVSELFNMFPFLCNIGEGIAVYVLCNLW